MTTPAAEAYRVERVTGAEPIGRRRMGARALGTVLSGLPMPSSKPKFEATLRIIDEANTVVYEKVGEHHSIDVLELEILSDLLRLDVEAFRARYDLPDTTPDA